MADKDMILGSGVQTYSPDDPAARPDRAKSLALAAVDEAYQEKVKHLYDTYWSAITGSDSSGQDARTATGLAQAAKVWAKLRGLVSNPPADA